MPLLLRPLRARSAQAVRRLPPLLPHRLPLLQTPVRPRRRRPTTTLRPATSTPTRTSTALFPTAGSAVSILWAAPITSTTTLAPPPGIGLPPTRPSTPMPRMVRPTRPATSITVVSSPTTCSKPTTAVSPALVPSLARNRALLPTPPPHPVVVSARCPQAGRSDTPSRVARTTSTTTPARRHGSILVARRLSVLWALTVRMQPFSPRPSPSSAPCRPAGRCVSRRLRVSTLWTTTQRRRRGTTLVCRRRWTPTCRSTSGTSAGSSSTSGASLRCATSRATARSRSAGTTYSRTATRRSCARRRTTSRSG